MPTIRKCLCSLTFITLFYFDSTYAQENNNLTLKEIRSTIVAELRQRSIIGQNKLLTELAELLKSNDPKFLTRDVVFDPQKSTLTSYAYADKEFAENYDPSVLQETLINQFTDLCNEPLTGELRLRGITQRIIMLNKEDDSYFSGIEMVASVSDRTLQESIAFSKSLQELAELYNKAGGVTTQATATDTCVQPIGWRTRKHEKELRNSDLNKQDKCELEKQLELERKYDIGMYSYRETELVQRVKQEYYDYIFSKCEPKWWEFWRKNNYDD